MDDPTRPEVDSRLRALFRYDKNAAMVAHIYYAQRAVDGSLPRDERDAAEHRATLAGRALGRKDSL